MPDAPEDPQPDNTSFVRRTLITQFTGLGCGYCPFMIAAMEDVRKSAEYADKSVLAACHTYGVILISPMCLWITLWVSARILM